MDTKIILLIIALGIIFEGLFIAISTKKARKMMLDIVKDKDKFKIIGWTEAVIGIILLAISILNF